MSDDRPQATGTGVDLTVTVSCEPGLVPTLEALVTRIGEYVGCASQTAQEVAQAVASVVQSACESGHPSDASRQMDVHFDGTDHLLRVDLTCRPPRPGDATLQAAVTTSAGSARSSGLVDRAEVSTIDGCPSCRLTRQFRNAR
ncbi:MAG: hypothetical protein AB7I50_12115 [Vicinamibacterales bacterium]